MGRKGILCTFQTTSKRNLTLVNLDKTKKKKASESLLIAGQINALRTN